MTRNTPFAILHFPMYPKHSQNPSERPRVSLKFILTKKKGKSPGGSRTHWRSSTPQDDKQKDKIYNQKKI
jgi:hypothetical protein